MNTKAENFQKYLTEKNITCFTTEEIAEDKLHTVVFRSSINLNNQLLPMGIILDDSIYSLIRVQIAPNVQNKDKLLAFFDELNAKYKAFKYYTNDSGVYLNACVLNTDINNDIILFISDSIVKNLNEVYPQIMEILWSK